MQKLKQCQPIQMASLSSNFESFMKQHAAVPKTLELLNAKMPDMSPEGILIHVSGFRLLDNFDYDL